MLPPPRHWFQFQLSTLLALVAILSVAAITIGAYREARRREAIRLNLERRLVYDLR